MDPKLAQRVKDADVILALGTRLGEIATQQYSLLDVPRPRQTLIHVHADPDELGRVFEAGRCRSSPARRSSLPRSARSTALRVPAGSSPRAPTTSRTSGTTRCPATSSSAT